MSVAKPPDLRKRTPATSHAVRMFDRAEYAARIARTTQHTNDVARVECNRELTQRERNALIKRLARARMEAYEAALAVAAGAYLREVDQPAPALEFDAVGTLARDKQTGRFVRLASA